MAWCLRTAVEQARAVRAGVVSATELVRQHIDRIERFDGAVNAVVVRIFEEALERAAAADAALARREVWGPLHGVPISVKECYMLRGTATTCAMPELRGNIAAANALNVQRLLDAGAIILGKTNVPPYAADYQSANPYYGRTNNPWDLQRTPGGSSGGSAAALACGFSALELGSDIGGSIRGPASWCGVFGHKPSYGLGHLHGHAPLATHRSLEPRPGASGRPGLRGRLDPSFHHGLGVGGPMARCCADLELALRLLSPPDPALAQNGWSFTLPPPRVTDPKALRAAAWLDFAAVPTDRECLALLRGAAEALAEAGAEVDFNARPFSDEQVFKHVGTYLQLLRASGPGFSVPGKPISHEDWVKLEVKRNFIKEAFGEFFERYDVLLCPVLPVPAIPHTTQGFKERVFRGEGIPDFSGGGIHMIFWPALPVLADLPATAVPVGRTASRGLPCGLQVVAGNFQDLMAIEVGKMLERCHPPSRYVPPPGYDVDAAARL